MTGRMPMEGINPEELPEEAAHVWLWFLQLNAKRPQAMSGISPISASEIYYFFCNRQITPEVWEVDALAALDNVSINAMQKELKT